LVNNIITEAGLTVNAASNFASDTCTW